jgi:hypothetical protein
MTHDGERTETTRDAAAEKLEHEHPAKPEQTHDEGFEQGYDQRRDTPEEELEPNFARGVSAEPPEGGRHGRFSTGEETTGDTPEKEVERRFSEGIERSPTSE